MSFSRLCTLVTLVCAALAACGGAFKPPAGDGPFLRHIRIEGTKAIPVEEIAPGLSIDRAREKRAVDGYQMSVDIGRVRAAYLKLGFFDVKVDARVDVKGREQTVVFVVTEGVRSITRVEILGLPPEIPYDDARKLVKLRDGQPFDYEAFDLAKQPMLQLVENAGYAQSDIQALVVADREQHLATIRFAVVPGERSTFGAISIRGAGPLEDAVRDRLTFRQGDIYTQSAMTATQNALYELNRFSTVRIEPKVTEGNVVPVIITLRLVKSGELRAGGGFGHDQIGWEARARFGISYIFDALPLWSFDVDARPALTVPKLSFDSEVDKTFRGTATAKRNDLFIPKLAGDIQLSFDFLHYEAFRTRGPRLKLGLSSPLGVPWLTSRVAWVIERQDFADINVTDEVAMDIGLDRPQRRGAFEGTISVDLRDNPFEVHKGAYFTMTGVKGGRFALGKLDYSQMIGEARGYIPLGGFVLAARLRVASLFGDVPVTERLFAGGEASHRGYNDRRLSPLVPHKDTDPTADPPVIKAPLPIGGTTSLENSIELRIPLASESALGGLPLGMSVFLDGGDVVLERDELDVFDQNLAVGLALYVKVLGFKVGGDIGLRITRADYSGSAWDAFWRNNAFHFVVGDAY